jgi:hypothetical protein
MFENGVEYRLVVVLGDGLLHFQQGFATTDLEAGDVVVEPGRFVNQVPAHTWFLDTGQTRESFADVPSTLRPPKAYGEAFGET